MWGRGGVGEWGDGRWLRSWSAEQVVQKNTSLFSSFCIFETSKQHYDFNPPPGVGGVGVGEGVGQWDTMSKYFGLLSSILCHSNALHRTKFNPPLPSGGGGGWGGSGGRWEVGGVVVAKTRRENSN